jgi:uncharacterized membrane protein
LGGTEEKIIFYKNQSLNKNKLAAFSDDVLAIVITIIALEFKVPNGDPME